MDAKPTEGRTINITPVVNSMREVGEHLMALVAATEKLAEAVEGVPKMNRFALPFLESVTAMCEPYFEFHSRITRLIELGGSTPEEAVAKGQEYMAAKAARENGNG